MAILRAYFDASERASGVFTVAGYLLDSVQARKFRREWNPLFAPYGGLHMTDLVALRGRYKNVARAESNALIKRAVSLIRSRIMCGVAVSCWVQDVQNHSPRWIRGFGHPYAVCCHLAMSAMGMWALDNDERRGIAYVFESGDQYAGEAHHMMSNATHPEIQHHYQYRSHAFIGKKDVSASPLEAADFLAWEWGKYFEETVAERKRPMRLSFASLLDGQFDRYALRPMFGERFMQYLDEIRDLGLSELQERREARDASAPMDLSGDSARATPDDEP